MNQLPRLASLIAVMAAAAVVVVVATAPIARAGTPAPTPPATPPVVAPSGPPALPPPALPPPAVEAAPLAAPGAPAAPTSAPATAPHPGAIPTADATPAPSDHDAVVGHVGIEARRLAPVPFPLTLRTPGGCPVAQTTPCTVEMAQLALRYWAWRNLAVDGGLALAFGGGRDLGRSLDTYLGVGPVVGVALLLGNWRHLAVSASPQASFVWFQPGGGGASSLLIDLRAALEGELHFGFVGVPALSVGIASGLGFRYETTADSRIWSVTVIGAASIWDTLSTLFIRYYL